MPHRPSLSKVELETTTTQSFSTASIFVDIVDTVPPVVDITISDETGSEVATLPTHGKVRVAVNYQATDVCDDNPSISATAGVPVEDGDLVKIDIKKGKLTISITQFVIDVTATDASGNIVNEQKSLPLNN